MRFLALGLLVAACTSSTADSPRAELIAPRFRVRQLAGQILPSPYAPTASIELLVDIFNQSSEPITLRRLQLQSLIGGGFRFQPTSRTFNKIIPPNAVETFDIAVNVSAESAGVDVHSPVTVRGTAIFDSPSGGFRRVFTSEIIEHGRPPGKGS